QPEQRGGIARLQFDVYRFKMVERIEDQRQVKLLRIGLRKAAVAVGTPLHGCSDTVAVTQVEIISHPDLVAIVDDVCTGQTEEQGIEQLNLFSVIFEQRSQTMPDS